MATLLTKAKKNIVNLPHRYLSPFTPTAFKSVDQKKECCIIRLVTFLIAFLFAKTQNWILCTM